ncbi:MAG: dodecin family protein [Candidatus Hodarchaeota archaeon]
MVIKEIELIGVSTNNFEEAVKEALEEASKTIREIEWIEVKSLGAKVKQNKIVEYQARVKVAFRIKR